MTVTRKAIETVYQELQKQLVCVDDITANSKEGTWDPVIDFVTLLPNDRRRYAFPCP